MLKLGDRIEAVRSHMTQVVEEIAELAKHGIYAQTVFCVCEWIDGHPIKLAEAYTKERAIEIAQKLGTDRIKEGDE